MTGNLPHPPAPTRVADVLQGVHLVVSGATGFVGKVWLSHLLAHVPNIGRVTLLVRGSARKPARTRVAELIDTSPAFRPLKERVGGDLGAWIDARVEVIDADLTKPLCGLSVEVATALAASADAYVHIAGVTDFQPDPRKGVPANCDGTRHFADLAELGPSRRFLHVSTAYVAGSRDGRIEETLEPGLAPSGLRFDADAEITRLHEVIAAHRTPTARTDAAMIRARELGWPNLYTFSKALAEHHLARRDLDLAIVRPSVVECARSWPFPGWNEGLNTSAPIMWYCGTAFRALPSTAHHVFDIVPVDAVSRWITVVLAQLLRGQAPQVSQLASGDVNPATFERIVELTALGKRTHARRSGAEPTEKLVAALDVGAARREDLPWFRPDTLERIGKEALGWLEERPVSDRLPRLLRRFVGTELDTEARRLRGALRERVRTLGNLRRMLEQYQPFIHDHDWRFVTQHIRDAVARLHPADANAFGDDLRTLDWRHYWLQVQYPGMVKWSFPLVDNLPVPEDPPSHPPLQLRGGQRATAQAVA